jgi:hypothetical protein
MRHYTLNAANDSEAMESMPFELSIQKMYKAMIGGLMNSKLEYFESSEAIRKIAQLNKEYYDALLEIGFTE